MVEAHVIGQGAHRAIALNGWFSDRTGYDGIWPYLTCYPNSSLEVLPNSGHYPMDEVPIASLTSMEAFLREVG